MRFIAVLLVFVVSLAVFQGDELYRDAKFAANDMTRDVRHWVASIFP